MELLDNTEDKVFHDYVSATRTVKETEKVHDGEVGILVNIEVEEEEDGTATVNKVFQGECVNFCIGT